MNKSLLTTIVTSAVLIGVVAVLTMPFWSGAQASSGKDEDEHEYENRRPLLNNETWRAECGDCHVAYPPYMLPASAWRVVMDGLDDHFGVDASVDPQTRAEITDFLVQHAGREQRSRDAPLILRITETRWFKHEHQEELPASIWQHPMVKSAANCEACHTQAAQGDYEEDNIHLPR